MAVTPVPVFIAVGARGRDMAGALLADRRVRGVATPRHAGVLVVLGSVAGGMQRPLARVHDQLPHPRATVWWDAPGDQDVIPAATSLPRDRTGAELAAVVVDRGRELAAGTRRSEPDLLPDEPPNPWKGVGPHGQGGEGMMMGVPYGRPMAMTADDRDGLALDQLPLTLGPFLPAFPPGLTLEVALQGDVLQSVSVGGNPFADRPPSPRATQGHTVAEVERASVRRHLHRVATILAVQGLPARSDRTRELAEAVARPGGGVAATRRLVRALRRSRSLRWSLAGIGVTAPDLRGHLSDLDAAATDHGGDAWARVLRRLAVIERSLESVADERTSGAGRSTHTEPTDVGLLAGLLPGMELGDAMATVASLDLDLEAASVAEVTR